ncbi:MAG: ABC transporter substrate-binding protein [Desulfobulbaceae bacterium]
MHCKKKLLFLIALAVFFCLTGSTVFAAKCLYVSSNHKGYEWSDGIERGLVAELKGKCEFKQFDMDTKRNGSDEFKKAAALRAKEIIESFKPDVVIVSDDDAVEYLVVPYYKDNALPFIFCGVNWSADKYGFPFKNVTGMLEVSPITAQINVAKATIPNLKKVFYLDSDNSTGQKSVVYYKNLFEKKGFEFASQLVKTFDEWKKSFLVAQEYDCVILRNNAGIEGWNDEEAKSFVLANTKKLSMTESDWVMPFALLGMTKVPEEQGEWAGKTALQVLAGADISKIKFVENNKSNIFINKKLHDKLQLPIPDSIIKAAKVVE